MNVEGKLTINCERCGKSYDFLKEDVKFKESGQKDESDMYVWELDFNCLRCSNPISIKYEVYMSDGTFKEKNLDIKGAKVAEDSFSFSN